MSVTTATTDRLLLAELIGAMQALIWSAYNITQPNDSGIDEISIAVLRNEIQNAENVLARLGVKS